MPPQKGQKYGKRARTAVGGNDDPYGNAAMNAFLKGYQRITCAEACGLGDVDLDRVTVWFRRAAKWERHQADDLLKGQDSRASICRALVTRLYGWTPWQYDALRDTFDDASSEDVMGIYANRRGDYAIVGRLPVSDRLVRGAIGIGGIMTGVGGMVLKDYLSSDDAKNPFKEPYQNLQILGLQLNLIYHLLPTFAHLMDDQNLSALIVEVQRAFSEWNVLRQDTKGTSSLDSHSKRVNDDVKGKKMFDVRLESVIKNLNEKWGKQKSRGWALFGKEENRQRADADLLKTIKTINTSYERLLHKEQIRQAAKKSFPYR
jgi:hypothetical protein